MTRSGSPQTPNLDGLYNVVFEISLQRAVTFVILTSEAKTIRARPMNTDPFEHWSEPFPLNGKQQQLPFSGSKDDGLTGKRVVLELAVDQLDPSVDSKLVIAPVLGQKGRHVVETSSFQPMLAT